MLSDEVSRVLNKNNLKSISDIIELEQNNRSIFGLEPSFEETPNFPTRTGEYLIDVRSIQKIRSCIISSDDDIDPTINKESQKSDSLTGNNSPCSSESTSVTRLTTQIPNIKPKRLTLTYPPEDSNEAKSLPYFLEAATNLSNLLISLRDIGINSLALIKPDKSQVTFIDAMVQGIVGGWCEGCDKLVGEEAGCSLTLSEDSSTIFLSNKNSFVNGLQEPRESTFAKSLRPWADRAYDLNLSFSDDKLVVRWTLYIPGHDGHLGKIYNFCTYFVYDGKNYTADELIVYSPWRALCRVGSKQHERLMKNSVYYEVPVAIEEVTSLQSLSEDNLPEGTCTEPLQDSATLIMSKELELALGGTLIQSADRQYSNTPHNESKGEVLSTYISHNEETELENITPLVVIHYMYDKETASVSLDGEVDKAYYSKLDIKGENLQSLFNHCKTLQHLHFAIYQYVSHINMKEMAWDWNKFNELQRMIPVLVDWAWTTSSPGRISPVQFSSNPWRMCNSLLALFAPETCILTFHGSLHKSIEKCSVFNFKDHPCLGWHESAKAYLDPVDSTERLLVGDSVSPTVMLGFVNNEEFCGGFVLAPFAVQLSVAAAISESHSYSFMASLSEDKPIELLDLEKHELLNSSNILSSLLTADVKTKNMRKAINDETNSDHFKAIKILKTISDCINPSEQDSEAIFQAIASKQEKIKKLNSSEALSIIQSHSEKDFNSSHSPSSKRHSKNDTGNVANNNLMQEEQQENIDNGHKNTSSNYKNILIDNNVSSYSCSKTITHGTSACFAVEYAVNSPREITMRPGICWEYTAEEKYDQWKKQKSHKYYSKINIKKSHACYNNTNQFILRPEIILPVSTEGYTIVTSENLSIRSMLGQIPGVKQIISLKGAGARLIQIMRTEKCIWVQIKGLCVWDVAAPCAILRQSGGDIYWLANIYNEPLTPIDFSFESRYKILNQYYVTATIRNCYKDQIDLCRATHTSILPEAFFGGFIATSSLDPATLKFIVTIRNQLLSLPQLNF